MANLSSVLQGIPGLRGWQAQDQLRQEQMQGDQATQINQMKLAQIFEQAQEQKKMQEIARMSGGDPAKAQELFLKAGMIDPASKAHGMIPDPTKIPKIDTTPLITNLRAAGIEPSSQEGQKIIKDFLQKGGDSGNPYFTPVSTETGLGSFDNRTGKILPLSSGGAPVIKASDSPKVRGAVAEATKLGTDTGEQKALLPNQKNALTSVDNAIGLMDKGIYTGAYANFKKSGAKYAPFVDTTKAANTENFLSEIGNTIVPRLKEFGGNDSNEELRYLRQISGGDITLEEPAMRAILAATKMKIERGIARLSQGMDVNGNPVSAQPTEQQTHNTMPNPKDYAGKIARDTVSGKRYQSNGTTWMLVK